MIFFVQDPKLWKNIGKNLINEAIKIGKEKYQTGQILVVCGDHDQEKYNFLEENNLLPVSRWYSKAI